MLRSTVYKLFAMFALVAMVYANTEAEMDQPTKLLGGKSKVKYTRPSDHI